MKSIFGKTAITLCVLAAVIGIGVMVATPAFAVDPPQCTNVLDSSWCESDDGSGIREIVMLVINIMTAGIFVAATAGLIWCGTLIVTARDDAGQVAKARTRMIEIGIGLAAWILSAVVINLVMPGGDPTGKLGTGGIIVTKVGNL